MSMLQHSTFSRLFYGGPSNNSSSNSYVNIQPVAVAAPERSHSPHSVDGSNPRPKRKNRERRGTENSLPVSFDAVQVAEDLQPDKDEATTPTAKKEPKRPKMEPSPDFQVPFPQVQDAARAKRDQLLRSPTLSAHSNTSSSHAPTASTANTTASGLTIPGAYDSGSGGSGVEVTPTRETVKVKRGSGSSVTGSNSSQTGFYQQLPPNPSPGPTTGSPQAQPRTSPSQAPRQPYAPPPPAPTMSSSTDSFDAPTLSRSYTTTTTSSLPTLPDSPPPEPKTQPAPLTLTTVANLLQSQPVPISPVHPRPMNRAPASVLGPTKMAETWTAGPPPEDLADEVQERKAHLTSARDGAAVRTHRPGGSLELKDVASWAQGQSGGSGPERQASVRRPKVVTQSSTGTVVQSPPQPITRTATMPIMNRYETTSPPPMRDQPPRDQPMRDQHGLHLELHDKPPPAPAPVRVGRGPSPSPNNQGVGASPGHPSRRAATPNNTRGRAPGPAAMTPPYTYEDQYRNRSGSHASSYTQPKPPAPAPPPPPAAQWTGTGIVPFNEDLDHDDHDGPDRVVDWAKHTQSQQPLSHPNQPTQQQPPPSAGRSRSRGRDQNAVAQPPLMDPGAVYSQQQQGYQQPNTGYQQHGSGYGQQYPQQQSYHQQQQPYPQQQQPYPQQQQQPAYQQQQRTSPEVRSNGGRSPAPPAHHSGGTGSGSSETEDLKTPRSPSVPLPGDGYNQRFGYNNQFSVGPPTVNHIYTQDLGPNGQMYPSMGFAQSQYALQQMGAGPQGMGMGMGVRQVNGGPREQYNYGYPQDLSSSASGSFLDGWTSNQMDGRGYPNHVRPSAPVPPTPSSATAPTSVSGDIRNGQPAHMARAQTVVYNGQQQQYPPYNYAQAQMSYAMDPYRAPSVVSSFMASPFSHNPFLPPVEPQSTASSPSHQPIGLPFAGPATNRRFGGARMGTKSMGRRRRMMQEFRPESTVPNDTASEAETEAKRAPDGAETEFETETEMEEVWLEESDDDELDNEYHPTYFVNPAKRKRRFEQKWEQMVKLFREIDRETDATMILAAAPPDQHQTHLLLSRAILRDTNYSHIAQEARSVFSDITIARRQDRTETLRRARQERQRKKAIDDRLASVAQLTLATQQNDNQVGSGSDETSVPATQSGPADQDIRLALDAARSSLQEMRRVYDEMETRHREESARRKEESLSLEKLLTSLLSTKTVQQSS